jgi:catechol 2,3-dioxygenase-like lactoylglutathione lyase family enzyme
MAPMTVERMDHVCIVVDDLEAATRFFTELGLELLAEVPVEGRTVDRINGLEGVQADIAMMGTPDGNGRLELVKYHSPPTSSIGEPTAPPNTPGLRHITFAVDDVKATLARLQPHGAELVGDLEQYEDSYLLCYIRGPEGVIIELAEKLS